MEVTEARELRSAGGEPDDETMAAKKRSRRVSFAETTAVHVFDRDEDLDTQSEPGVEARSLRWGDHSESDDDSKSSAHDDEDEDEEEEGEQVLFVRDMDSSSPGSAVGSFTSNDDDDNFFGPVSASFISSGRLSEAGMSDDNNHDITLDSTAFSLHFRNIAPPPPDDRTANSVGSIRTPTGETMPGPAGPRSFNKSKISGSASDSNSTMSLIVDNPDRYDYGRISPTLEALLAEVDRSIRPSSPNGVKESGKYEAPIGDRAVSDDKADDDSCLVAGRINSGNTTHDAQLTPCIDTSTDDRTKDAGHHMVKDYCKDDHKATQSDIVAASAQSSDLLLTPYRKSQSNLIVKSDIIHQSSLTNEGHVSKYHSNFSSRSAPSAQEMVVIDGQQRMESEYGTHTPKNAVQTFHSPLQGCVSSIHAKRQHLFLDHTVLPQTRLIQSPTREQPPSSLKMEITGHSDKISAIKSHVSKFKIPETPILVSSIPALSGEDHMLHDYEGNLDKINKATDNHKTKDMVTSANCIEEYLMNTFQTAGEYQTSVVSNHSGCKTPTHSEKNKVIGESVKLTDTISTLQSSTSKINAKLDSLTSYNPIDLVSSPNANGSSQMQTSVEHKKNSQDYCTPGAGGTIRSSSLLENRLPSLTPFPTPISNDLRTLQSLNELANNNNDTILYNPQEEIQSSSDFHLRSQDVNTAIKTGLTNVREKLSAREMLASSYELTRGDAFKQAAIAGKSEIFADTVRRIDKETVSLSDKNILDSFSLMDTMPPISTQDPRLHGYDINCQDPFSLRESFSAQDVDIVGRKRKIEHNLLKEKHLINEISRAQKNPKLLTKVIDNIPVSSSGHHVDCNNEATDIGAQPTLKHWTDIFFKVSEATKAQFSPIYKLTLKEIDLLEVILGELQTTRKYERLYTSLRNNECLGHPHQHRIAEARLLQDKLVFEQAKLQLKRMKLDLLCNKSQLSQSRVRECHKLKSLFSQLICVPRSFQTHGTWLHSDSIKSNDQNQEEQNKVASMKQELEILEQKARCLVKTFEASCKIKGNIDCDGIIKVVNENLEMRSHRRVIRQDLQLWELGDIMKKNDQSEIVLNYHNFLCQRFTINIDQVSSIVISNLSNDANIEKNFPNMNAFIAFEFVFKAKGARRLASSKCFQQETLVTSLLLGNLLDVLKEVQVSRRELWNLICSDFHSQCSGQLELQLCFVNLKSGRKVTLGLDMTDLDCAIYPSKPSELQYRMIPGTLTTLQPSVMDEIVSSIPSLQDGRPMILRLCRHISDVVQASS